MKRRILEVNNAYRIRINGILDEKAIYSAKAIQKRMAEEMENPKTYGIVIEKICVMAEKRPDGKWTVETIVASKNPGRPGWIRP